MCVALIVPQNVRPSLETLRACERANPHGGGIAWRKAGWVHWIKTNDVNEIYKLACKIKGEVVIHFRIASVGAVCDELRHPFPITRNARLNDRGKTRAVLFQNGTWPGYEAALKLASEQGRDIPDGPMSDTRAAAFLASINGHKFLSKCGHSRWVYFSATQTITYGQWYKRDGIYYSNLHWQPLAPLKPHQQSNQGIAAGEEVQELWDLSGVENYWEKICKYHRLNHES